MSCADDCHAEFATRPTLWGSGPVRASVLAWVFVIGGLSVDFLKAPPAWGRLLFSGGILGGSFYFAREGFEKLWRKREIGIEYLMTMAIVSAALLGRWREAALVASLYSITEALEGYTLGRTRYAIRNLMDLVPPKAHLIRDGREMEVDLKDVKPGDRIQVRPGESIPVDGVVRAGSSSVNEAAITGESLPAEREPGEGVFAGTLNGEGALEVEATKPSTESTVARIIERVERAQAQKGRSQLFVEKFGKVYSPAVLGASVLLAVVPPLFGLEWASWARRAVSFLVAASPCALAVATPVTLVAAIGSAAKRGVLMKGGVLVETLGKIRAVAIDKTGTLTRGEPALRKVLSARGSEEDLLRRAAALEHFSEHPIGKAIARGARERRLELPPATDFKSLPGAGVEGTVEGRRVAILKPARSRERGAAVGAEAEAWLKDAEGEGHSVAVVLEEGVFAGLLAVADTLRPEARLLVRALKQTGVDHVVMLTGDNEGTARAIAREAGIEEFYAGLLPEEKVAKVKELRGKYGEVAMVGDGVNDAPALAAASVGIAMGVSGSDAALAAADVALMADDLSKIPYAIALGKRSRRVIFQNLAVSSLIVAGLVVGTFAAGLSMLAAILGHEGSEVLIILNGLRVALTGARSGRSS